MKSILVIGSSNTDMVIKSDRIPGPGETILGGRFFMNPGGKGANQAVAAARLGGKVTFVAKTGNDIFGGQAAEIFRIEGIDTSFIFMDPTHPSGIALITVDKDGENSIVVAPGSNAQLLPADIDKALTAFDDAACVLVQLEVPLETVTHVASITMARSRKLILNPAPGRALPDSLLRNVTVITPNETEAQQLTGIRVTDAASAEQSAKRLRAKGVKTVVVTSGADGAYLLHDDAFVHIPSPRVQALDTTAAGDVFNGALAVALVEGLSMTEAVRTANQAASISVTRLGAQASAPYRKEIATLAI